MPKKGWVIQKARALTFSLCCRKVGALQKHEAQNVIHLRQTSKDCPLHCA